MTNDKHMRPVIFGEVLFDHFPDGRSVLGGAPFNVAWHLQAFGLKPLMISRLGGDEQGRTVLEAMKNWGMDCAGVQMDANHPTGTVEVHICDGDPSYEIVYNVAYDFIEPSQLPRLDGNWLLYHGSLAARNEVSASSLAKLKQECRDGAFVDINLRPPWCNRVQVLGLIKGASWVKLNTAELTDIYPDAQSQTERLDHLSAQVSQHIFLTDGEHGATAISTTTNQSLSVTPQTTATVMDTVGAGDSFCSVLVAGQVLGWPLDVSLRRAQAFASAVVSIRGATTQDKYFYRPFICDWGLGDSEHV